LEEAEIPDKEMSDDNENVGDEHETRYVIFKGTEEEIGKLSICFRNLFKSIILS